MMFLNAKKFLFSCFGLVILLTEGYSNELARRYINKYKDVAISEMQRTGIPASIKLAQGLLESGWGKSLLTKKANNHFGIKCGPSWDGDTYFIEDDDYDKRGRKVKSCFRVYDDAIESYIAHSEFLTDSKKVKRYGFLFSIPVTDYKAWAKGLYKAGYATDSKYSRKLISIIEQYDLNMYDDSNVFVTNFEHVERERVPQEKTREKIPSSYSRNKERNYINGIAMVLPEKNESLEMLSDRINIPMDVLRLHNEQLGFKEEILAANIPIFLKEKKDKYTGNRSEHRVRRGEDMFQISQKYGIKLSKLYVYNRIPEGAEPVAGEILKLNSYVHWGKRPRFKEQMLALNSEGSEILFADEDFESQHRSRSK